MSLLIEHAHLLTPHRAIADGWLLADDGVIRAIGVGDAPTAMGALTIDAGGAWLLPGFIDLHVHGGAGADTMDADPQALATMARFYAQHGVTAFLATTWTDTPSRIDAALDAVRALLRATGGRTDGGATLIGAHIEGPYINPAFGGAQNVVHIRRADMSEASAWLQTGVVRLMALAPEFPENQRLLRACVAHGVTVSAAHTGATYDEMIDAVALGLTQATHTANAMTGLHHRQPGALGAVLTESAIRAELIADNLHVHPAVMRLIYAAKGAYGVILISDAIRGAGMPDGDYPVDERIIHIRDGAARLADGTLAGSTVTMDRALANFAAATGAPLTDLWRTTSLNAAEAIGISARKGSIAIGKDADFVLMNDAYDVLLTVTEGEIAFRVSA